MSNNLQALLTSIVLKQNVTLLDMVSTRMLGQFGFLAKVNFGLSNNFESTNIC